MPTVDVYNMAGEKVKEIALAESVFGCELRPHLLHDVVVWQMANRRAATARTKGRSEVSGGGRKPYKQKGTGRARAGSNRSPLWRTGGVIFGPNGRKYAQKMPKKVRQEALRTALSMKCSESVIKVVDSLSQDEIKTRRFVQSLKALEMEHALVVSGNLTREISLSARNHATSKILDVKGLNVYDILKYPGLVLDLEAVAYIEARLTR